MAANVKEVFLSHCVASMGERAVALNEKIQAEGCSTFICTQIDPGDDFRTQINVNAANCKVMVILLDEKWANSLECLAEFKCAFSCYTTSKGRAPQIVPIVVGGFQWINPEKYANIHCIKANFQCIPLQNNDWEEVNKKLLARINARIADSKPTDDAAAKSASHNQAFIDFVTCEICDSLFNDPKMLPCGHTFCKTCLINWKELKGDLTCPKCGITCSEGIDNLEINFRANQIILINSQTKNQDASQMQDSSGSLKCEPELAAWFDSNKIPETISQVLIDNGFEFLDVVLDMTEVDIKELGMKIGHAKKLLKSINDHKSVQQDKQNCNSAYPSKEVFPTDIDQIIKIEGMENLLDSWKIVEELYDDRVLSWGTDPTDSLKFWASLTKQLRDSMVDSIKKLGLDLKSHPKMATSIKSKCLQKVAMVLCDAGEYSDAVEFASSALSFESCQDREYEIKVLLVYATHNQQKEPMWVDDTKDTSGYKRLADLCKDVIEKGKRLSPSKLCKVYIIKAFTFYSMVNRSRSLFQEVFPEAEADLTKALDLCQKENLEGLKAEALMTKSLMMAMVSRNDKSRKTLLEARKLCLNVYGEFNTLSARIYYNLGIDFEVKKDKAKAYECFRRCWLIDRQVFGVHHPTTQKSGSVLTDDYKDVAKKLKDTLPDTYDEPTQKDREYSKRVKFLNKMTK